MSFGISTRIPTLEFALEDLRLVKASCHCCLETLVCSYSPGDFRLGAVTQLCKLDELCLVFGILLGANRLSVGARNLLLTLCTHRR